MPSAMATALGKAGKNRRKTPDFPALPSVIARTLGKAGLFAECEATALGKEEGFAERHRRHSANNFGKAGFFAECQATALGKGEGFAECHRRHSAKELLKKNKKNSLPRADTRQTISGKKLYKFFAECRP